MGATETDALAPFLASGDLGQQMEELTPIARLGTTEDIFEIDGGTVASNWPIKVPAF